MTYCAYCGSHDLDDDAATCLDCPVIDIICPSVSKYPLFTGRMTNYPAGNNFFQLTVTADQFRNLARWSEKI